MGGRKLIMGGRKVIMGGRKLIMGGRKVIMGGRKLNMEGRKVIMGGRKDNMDCRFNHLLRLNRTGRLFSLPVRICKVFNTRRAGLPIHQKWRKKAFLTAKIVNLPCSHFL